MVVSSRVVFGVLSLRNALDDTAHLNNLASSNCPIISCCLPATLAAIKALRMTLFSHRRRLGTTTTMQAGEKLWTAITKFHDLFTIQKRLVIT